MAVDGVDKVIKGVNTIFEERLKNAEQLSLEMARKSLNVFRQRQYASPHIPGNRSVQDTDEKKNKARKFADKHQNASAVTVMGMPWINRSFRAARSVFADAGISKDGSVYFNLHHTMSYGVYLELANNRSHAVIEPIVRNFAPEFLEGLRKIYGG